MDTKNNNLVTLNNLEWSKKIIDAYFDKIMNLYHKNKIPIECYVDILIIISDALPYLKDNIWEKIGYSLCEKIKCEIETEGINPYQIGMFSHLGHQAFAVNLYFNRTGNLPTFSNSLNNLLLKIASKRAQALLDSKPSTFASHYDCIAGISGILYYLLDVVDIDQNLNMLTPMVNYLIYLTKFHKYGGYLISNFHIPKENLYTDLEKRLYQNGYLNLGLSHGMLGPLLAMSKAKLKGLETTELSKAIETINTIYNRFMKFIDRRPVWPCYIAPMEYIKNLEPQYTSLLKIQRSSWCYGNVSIARGFHMLHKNNKNYSMAAKYMDYLIEIIDTPIKNYNLDNPGICHGFASIIAIGAYAYDNYKSERLLLSTNRCISEIQKRAYNENLTPNDMIDKYFEMDISLLQGAGGLTAALLKNIIPDMEFGKIMMIQ